MRDKHDPQELKAWIRVYLTWNLTNKSKDFANSNKKWMALLSPHRDCHFDFFYHLLLQYIYISLFYCCYVVLLCNLLITLKSLGKITWYKSKTSIAIMLKLHFNSQTVSELTYVYNTLNHIFLHFFLYYSFPLLCLNF